MEKFAIGLLLGGLCGAVLATNNYKMRALVKKGQEEVQAKLDELMDDKLRDLEQRTTDKQKEKDDKSKLVVFWSIRRDLNPLTVLPAYSLSRGAPSATWVLLQIRIMTYIQLTLLWKSGGESGIRTHGSLRSHWFSRPAP